MLSRFMGHRHRLACNVAAVDRRTFWRLSSGPNLVPTVLFEDNHLLVLAKPACMPSVPDESGMADGHHRRSNAHHSKTTATRSTPNTRPSPAPPPPIFRINPHPQHPHHSPSSHHLPTRPPGDHSLLEWGKAYIRKAYNKPGEAWLAPVHRIDRPVSGVVCFARTSKAADRLSEQVSRGQPFYTAPMVRRRHGGLRRRHEPPLLAPPAATTAARHHHRTRHTHSLPSHLRDPTAHHITSHRLASPVPRSYGQQELPRCGGACTTDLTVWY